MTKHDRLAELRAFVADGAIVTGGMDRAEVLAVCDAAVAARRLLRLGDALVGGEGVTASYEWGELRDALARFEP